MGEVTDYSQTVAYHSRMSTMGHQIDEQGNQSGSEAFATTVTTLNKGSNFVSGELLPQWRDIVRAGGNATTHRNGEKFTMDVEPFFSATSFVLVTQPPPPFKFATTHKYITQGTLPYDSFAAYRNPPASTEEDVRNRCIRKFIDKCTSLRSSIEGGQDIGEYKQTLQSVHKPLSGVQDLANAYLTNITKRSKKGSKNISLPALHKVIADTYLEFRFGINPIVADVASLYSDLGRQRFRNYSVEASASDTHSGSDGVFTPPQAPYQTSYDMTRNSNARVTYRYKGAYRVNVDLDGRIGLASSLRLLPEDWAPTVWDLLPWSWMIDYFVNIGDLINAASFVTSNLSWGCVTKRYTTTVTYEGNGQSVLMQGLNASRTEGYSASAYGGKALFEHVRFLRRPFVDSDLHPTFEFRIPKGKYPYLNMLAIVAQKASRVTRLLGYTPQMPKAFGG